MIAVHSCKRLPGEKTAENYNLFLRMNPMSFFFFFVGSYKDGKLNVSTSNGSLFACKQVLYPEPFPQISKGFFFPWLDGFWHFNKVSIYLSISVQEIKVLTSFGPSVKNTEGGDGATFWLESENAYDFTACLLEPYELARPPWHIAQVKKWAKNRSSKKMGKKKKDFFARNTIY